MKRLRTIVVRMLVAALVMGALAGIVSWRLKARLPKKFVLELVLSGPIRESPKALPMGFVPEEKHSLMELCRGVRDCARDPRVEGLLVRISSLQTGWAASRELARALSVVQQAGKRVAVLLESATDMEYLVACAVDSVFLNPAGHLLVDGLALEVGFWKDAMDKVGLEAQVERVGEYKSAPEVFTRSGMSPQFRESLDSLLTDVYSSYVRAVAQGRRLSEERVRELIDQGPYSAHAALEAGLVDGLRYRSDLLRTWEVGEERVVPMERYVAARRPQGKVRLAYVVVEGPLVAGKSSQLPFAEPMAGSETVCKALREARENPEIEGVLLRVDSPGGSAVASDVIWEEVRLTGSQKPVVVSMGNSAASGGYYVAMPAQRIVAEPTTVTGSIGVFAGKVVAKELYDKVGYHVEVLTRGTHADLFSGTRPFTPEERQALRRMLEDFYWNSFVAKAAQGRHMDPTRVDHYGRGRIWSGVSAVAAGLVDTLGGIWEAQGQLLALLNLPAETEVVLEPFPKPKPLAARILEMLTASEGLAQAVDHVRRVMGAAPEGGVLLQLPFRLSIQ